MGTSPGPDDPDALRSEWPGVEEAYAFVLPSYQWMVTRLEAADSRIQTLLAFIATVSLAMPTLLGASLDQLAVRWALALGALAIVVFVVALTAAVPFGLWVDHSYGVARGEGFSTAAPWYLFNMVSRQADRLADTGLLAASNGYSTLERMTGASADPRCLTALAAGAAVVLGLMWLRLRFTWWPIHPILFLIWGTWAARVTAFSFLLGWLIKTLTKRFGLQHTAVKPFMIGVIAGDLCGGILWMIVGAVYWAATGEQPPRYHVFPGG
ncbi:hypothetical protein LCGC14_1086240 [marine sediment metagenome]|uniref:DUF6784 domain-containing protein n=1 Tax=marine sediment metagenome TaxID=412755 RepID=A0A0F9QJN1_9ZZZZ